MKHLSWKAVYFVLITLFLIPTEILAIPLMIHYQGKINASGSPLAGTGYFRFAIVDASGSAQYWSNDGNDPPVTDIGIPVSEGLFNVILGDTAIMNSLPASVFEQDELYLRIWFNDGTTGLQQLAPDQRLTSLGFAYQAYRAEDADTVDGTEASDLEESAEIDADISAHASNPSAHHTKTTSFTELTDSATDEQVPNDITVNAAAYAMDADTLDTLDSLQFLRSDVDDTAEANLTVSGNLGIGTPPSVTVDIMADDPEVVIKTSATKSRTGRLRLQGARDTSISQPYARVILENNLNGGYEGAAISAVNTDTDPETSGAAIVFETNDGSAVGERMRISDAGNVGIGLTSPNAKLDVNGNANIRGLLEIFDNAVVRGESGYTSHGLDVYSDEETIRFPGSTSDYIIAVEDGSGTVNNYWNASTYSNDGSGERNAFLVGNKAAGLIDWNVINGYWKLAWASGNGTSAGDTIEWIKSVMIDLITGNISTDGALHTGTSVSTDGAVYTSELYAGGLAQSLDQSQTTCIQGVTSPTKWQSFTPAITGCLTRLDFNLYIDGGTDDITFKIFQGEGINGECLSEEAITISSGSGWKNMTLTVTPFLFAEQKYTFQIIGNIGSMSYAFYSDYYTRGRSNMGGDTDYSFRTYMSAPATIHLTADGKAGIGTDSPTSTLTVAAPTSDTPGECGIRFQSDANANHSFGLRISTAGDKNLLFDKYYGGWTSFMAVNREYGRLGIGTDTPARTLHISDTMRLEPRPDPPGSASEGDIYMDSTEHVLRVYDGTAWQNCW